MNTYSQCGQDEFVMGVFKGLKHGYFVDIGAANGIELSNTYALEKDFQWDGLCIEPHQKSFVELKANRKCAVDDSFVLRDGETVDYREFNNIDGWEHLFSSIHPGHHDDRVNRIRKVPTTSLYTLLEKYHAPTVIHFMSIDVEGCEYDILKDFFDQEYRTDPNKFFTRYILTMSVEHNYREPDRTNIRELLAKYNMIPIKELKQDDFYIHQVMDILV